MKNILGIILAIVWILLMMIDTTNTLHVTEIAIAGGIVVLFHNEIIYHPVPPLIILSFVIYLKDKLGLRHDGGDYLGLVLGITFAVFLSFTKKRPSDVKPI